MKEEYFVEIKIKRRIKNYFEPIDQYKGDLNDSIHYLINKYGFSKLKKKIHVINKNIADCLFGG